MRYSGQSNFTGGSMKKGVRVFVGLFILLTLMGLATTAGAFPQYSTSGGATGYCADCHGAFASGPTPYLSQHDGAAWKNPTTAANMNIHDGHRTYMLSSDCNACHGATRTPVILNLSNGGTGLQPIGCSGCHNGDGLRQHHESSGAYACSGCHAPGTPPAENVAPPYYFTPDAAHPNKPTDPCNANGSESRVAPTAGLDNDGNLLYDAADPACKPAVAVLGVSPATLSFGSQPINTSSVAQTVTISNTGTANLSVTGISNTDAVDFTVTSAALPLTILPATSQTFTVAFKPTTTGAKSASIGITSNGGSGSVSASGTGVAPSISVLPASLTFASQTTGTTSAGQTVTITNAGTASLTVNGLTNSNATDFVVTSPAIPFSVGAGLSQTFTVAFAPATAGAKSATITIGSNAGSASVGASGTAVTPAALSVSPGSLVFGNTKVGTISPAQAVTITNTGGTAMAFTSISKGGKNPLQFAQTNNCPASLAAGASCTVNVTFNPTWDSAVPMSALINVNVVAPAVSQAVAISGTTLTTSYTLAPSSLAFVSPLNVQSVAQTMTVTNDSATALAINSITIGGMNPLQFAQTNNCPASLAAGASCTVNVTFKPTWLNAAPMSATINVNAAAPAGSKSAVVTGTIGAPTYTVTPDLSFTSLLNVQTAAQAVTVYNSTPTALAINSITIGGTNPLQFAQTNNCPASLAAGASCTVNVTFKPTWLNAAAPMSATINVSAGSPAVSKSAALTGTISGTAYTIAPASLSFSSPLNVESAGQTVTVTNATGTAVAINSISIVGTNSLQFLQTNDCPASLAAGDSCTVSVTFNPTWRNAVPMNAKLSVNVAAPAYYPAVALSGTVL